LLLALVIALVIALIVSDHSNWSNLYDSRTHGYAV